MARTFSDLDLVKAVQTTGDSEAMRQLINNHSGIYTQMVNAGLSPEYELYKKEMLEDKNYNMFKWALNFNPDKNMKYSVWIGQNVRWKCLNIINRTNLTESLDEVSIDCSCEEQVENFEEKILEEIKNLASLYPDKRILPIIEDRYFSGRKSQSWKKIAKKLQTSPNQCLTIHKKFLEWAKPKIKKYI